MQGKCGIGDKPAILGTMLADGRYDIICLQEATEPLGCYNHRVMHGDVMWCNMPLPLHPRESQHSHNYTALYHRRGNVNSRCSMVTYIKTNLLQNAGVYTYIQNNAVRGILYVQMNIGFNVGNIHLSSGNENAAYGQLNQYIQFMQTLGAPFCIIGDYNINSLNNRDRISLNNRFYDVGIYGQSTHTGNACLDYMYSPHMVPIAIVRLDKPGRYSDHSPVAYDM